MAHGTLDTHGTAQGAGAASGHADLVPAGSHAVVSYNPDAPSEAWGWHGHWRAMAPKTSAFLLWLGVFLLLCLNFTTHRSNVEGWYYNGIAILMAVWLVWRQVSWRRAQRRSAPPVGD